MNQHQLPRIRVCLVLLLLAATFQIGIAEDRAIAAPPADPSPATAPDSPAQFTDQQIIQTLGWYLAADQGMANIEISDAELATLLKGWSAGLNNQPAPYDLQSALPDVDRLVKKRREKLIADIRKRNRDQADKFFADLKKKPNIISLPSGAYCEIINAGAGPSPKPQQTITAHFVGRLIDGTEFDQMGPTDFVFVANHAVCNGWMDAIQKIGKGGKLILYVPPPLSDDDASAFGIEPDSTMIFEIDLIDFKDTPAQALADALVPAAPKPPDSAPSGLTDSQIIQTWGWMASSRIHSITDGLTATDLATLTSGLASGIKGDPSPFDLQKIGPVMQDFVQTRQRAYRQTMLKKRNAESDAFFAQLKKNPKVVSLPSGLCYEIVQPGTGPFPRADQTVSVRYTGKLIDGHVFDSTTLGPLQISLSGVIPGWTEGMQKINKGGKINLYIPPNLGYGDDDMAGIPAHSTLIFEIQLLDIKETPAH